MRWQRLAGPPLAENGYGQIALVICCPIATPKYLPDLWPFVVRPFSVTIHSWPWGPMSAARSLPGARFTPFYSFSWLG